MSGGLLLLHGVMFAPVALPEAISDRLGAALPIEAAGLVAIASRAPVATAEAFADADFAAEAALAHHRILVAIAECADVAPIAFGAVARDEAEARALITARAAALRDALQAIAGAVEYAARLVAETASLSAADTRPDPLDGRSYLAARRAGLEERRTRIERREAFCADVSARLAAHARASLRSGREGRPLDLALLVPRGASERALSAEGERVWAEAPAHGLRFEISGPWPAYSFTAPPADAAAA